MSPTPPSSRMNPLNGASALRLTPQTRYLTNQGQNKTVQDGAGLSMSLQSVIGTTTNSCSGFDCLPQAKSFALCAGSVVVLAQLDEDLSITQRYFRAVPTVVPINATTSFYNQATPPGRSRLAGSLRDAMFGSTPTGSPRKETTDSAGKGMVHQRMKAAKCVSLSPDATLLAVGEIGYNPRVLIFSTALNAPQHIPLSSIWEHTFGVRCVAFSPDSRYLCSVGDTNDGFVYVWAVHPRTGSARLHFTNRCTSNVRDITWIGGSIVTVGTRHVKVWRVPQAAPVSPSKTRSNIESDTAGSPTSPAPKTLAGRNCLLGPLLDAAFTCVASISEFQAIVCTDGGDICILDDSTRAQQFEKVANVGFSVACITVDHISKCAWIGGADGSSKSLSLDVLSRYPPQAPFEAEPIRGSMSGTPTTSGYIAMGTIDGRLITLDSNRAIKFHHIERLVGEGEIDAVAKYVTAPRSAVLGVSALHQPNEYTADFFTWSADGSIMFWALDGSCKGELRVDLDSTLKDHEGGGNELKVVRACAQDGNLLLGDRSGFLRLVETLSGKLISATKAHTSDINDITMVRRNEMLTLVGSCGRDRTIQIFKKLSEGLSLLQTLDDHGGSIGQLTFSNDGTTLLSSSSDRTVVVRTLVLGSETAMAYVPLRIITLKASPIAFTTIPDNADTLIISSMDRQIQIYEISSGRQIKSIKASDSEQNDAVVLNAVAAQRLQNTPFQSAVVVGVASADKSIRIYECDNGTMLTKEHGHTEGISDVEIIQSGEDTSPKTNFVSTGLDGIIMVWELRSRIQRQGEADSPVDASVNQSVLKLATASDQPTRRVLTRAELSELQRGLETAGDLTPQTPPTRDGSPSRLKRKTSRYTLSTQPAKTPAPPLPPLHPSAPILSASNGLKSPQARSPTPPTPKTTRPPKPPRPSPHTLHRTKSAGNLNDPHLTAEQLCTTLRAYRKKLRSTATGLPPDSARDLARELHLTACALAEVSNRSEDGGETVARAAGPQLYTDELARIIDERVASCLATQARSRDIESTGGVEEDSAALSKTVEEG